MRAQSNNRRPSTNVINHSGAPYFWFEQTGPEGERFDVLAVRASFDFGVDGNPVTFAKKQKPIVLGDVYASNVDGDTIRSVVIEDGDIAPFKPGTDILVTGSAKAPGGKPALEWIVGIRVGTTKKALRLHGPRLFRKKLIGWELGRAAPVESVALDYRLAYGGAIVIPAAFMENGEDGIVKHPSNPAGCGWLPSVAAYAGLPRGARDYVEKWASSRKVFAAPQIEGALDPVRHPYSNLSAQGFSSTARWWSPRVELQGNFDEHWRRTRSPLLPVEFSSRYFQNASSELVASPYLKGDETISMVGLLPERCEMCLPGWQVIISVKRASGAVTINLPPLDTLRFDLKEKVVSLVWRANYREDDDPVVEIAIGVTGISSVRERDTATERRCSGTEI